MWTRRDWMQNCFAGIASAEIAAAQKHAHEAARSDTPVAFQTLDRATAREIEAVAAQIIPSTDTPAAREAGVIYFIDRALSTFHSDQREEYRLGMSELQRRRKELFPDSTSIAALTEDQQIQLIRSIETTSFFELLRTHTVLGFLADPSYGGNRGRVGWTHIGFEDRRAFQPPFGYYDAPINGRRE